jgi:hypothetical protein
MVKPLAPLRVRAFMNEVLHMALAKHPRGFCDGVSGSAESGFHDFGKSFKEEAPVDQNGDPANPHCAPPENKKPLDFGTLLG